MATPKKQSRQKKKIDLDQIYDLASRGYSITMIASAMNVSRSTIYGRKEIHDTIKRGSDEARQKIINDLFSRSEADIGATASIFLAKQLKIFEDYYPTSTPKTPKEALTKIGNIYEAVARNELSGDRGDKLIRYLEAYVKAYEINEIDVRVAEIEQQLKEWKDRRR